MQLLKENLIDEIWSAFEERPSYPAAPVIIVDTKYSGNILFENCSTSLQTKFQHCLSITELENTTFPNGWLLFVNQVLTHLVNL